MDSLLPSQVSAFVEALYRLGLPAKAAEELEAFWWFMGPEDVSPEDLAAAVFRVCPCLSRPLSPAELMHRRGCFEAREPFGEAPPFDADAPMCERLSMPEWEKEERAALGQV